MAVLICKMKSGSGITKATFFSFYVCDMFPLKDIIQYKRVY